MNSMMIYYTGATHNSPRGSQNPTGGRAPMPSKAIFNDDPADARDATRDTGLKATAVRREAMIAVIRNMTTLLSQCVEDEDTGSTH